MMDLGCHMGRVASRLLGEPNRRLSSESEWRYGTHGSLSVDLEKKVWFDHEKGEGGGVLELIARETGLTVSSAVDWLRNEGLDVGESRHSNERRMTATYHYRDEHGELLFQVCRFEPKDFRQRAPDGSWSIRNIRRVLYRLPELLAAKGAMVFIVEGEKDADRLASLGLCATTCPGGANKWRPEYADPLAGRDVVILPDNDPEGIRHAEAVRSAIAGKAKRAGILRLDGLPHKGDVSDWLDAGGMVERLSGLAEEALGQNAEASGPRTFVASSLAHEPVPERVWHVPGLIPAHTVTTLNGDGGTGKSLIALQLAAATALGGRWLGQEVEQGSALFLTAEDDRAELHRRLVDVARAAGTCLAELGQLMLVSLAGENAILATPDVGSGTIARTPLFTWLDGWIAANRPRLVVLDTLADLFGGQENDRAQARQFVQLLRGIAIRHRTTVLLLAHPSLTGLASGTGNSGSTAWSNSVRSRLYLQRPAGDSHEQDSDVRTLTTVKANYGPVGGEIRVRYRDGVFEIGPGQSGLDRMAAGAKAERIFMDLLRAYGAEGRNVTATPCSTYAPSVFTRDPRAEGVTKRAFEAAMNALFARKAIRVGESGPPSRRRSRIEESPG